MESDIKALARQRRPLSLTVTLRCSAMWHVQGPFPLAVRSSVRERSQATLTIRLEADARPRHRVRHPALHRLRRPHQVRHPVLHRVRHRRRHVRRERSGSRTGRSRLELRGHYGRRKHRRTSVRRIAMRAAARADRLRRQGRSQERTGRGSEERRP